MLFRHPSHPGRAVRLAYCMNLHAAESLDELVLGIERITSPLRDRIAPGREFGVGMYVPGALARELANDAAKLAHLKAALDRRELDPFTFNAFPFGGFQTDGLKEGVFEPRWDEEARLAFTLDVARVATALARGDPGERHVSISTHAGAHASYFRRSSDRSAKLALFARGFRRAAAELAALEAASGRRIVLSIEPEPRSSANDTSELTALFAAISNPQKGEHADREAIQRHLGACLDTCHAAVEFEPERRALGQAAGLRSARLGAGLGKVQWTSALSLRDPAGNPAALRALIALDEPRFLHQVTGHAPGLTLRAPDLGAFAAEWEEGEREWRRAFELRCHFHVPIDAERLGDGGLATTRAYADGVLALALAQPAEWGTGELHVEIETYTWDVLPREARGAGELVDALEREYRHAIEHLERAGWRAA
jgi:sugar phosphate isomerase/epimerase